MAEDGIEEKARAACLQTVKADIERLFGIGPWNAGRLAEEFSQTEVFSKMERLARRAVEDAEAGRYDPSRFPWLRLEPANTRFQENPGKAGSS